MFSYYLFELKRYFSSASTYVFLILALLILNVMTFFMGGWFAQNIASLDLFFSFIPWVFIFLAPALMMSTWADDYKRKTAEFVIGLPLSIFSVGIAKFLAAWTVMLTLLALTFPIVISVFYLGNPDLGPILGGYFAAVLFAGFMLMLSYLGAVVSKGQIGAFSIGLLLSFFSVLSSWGLLTSLLREYVPAKVLDTLIVSSPMNRYEQLYYGLLDFQHVVFFITSIAMGLVLAQSILMLRHGGQRKKSVYALFFVLFSLLNISAHKLNSYVDLTEEKRLSVSENLIKMAQDLSENSVQLTLYYSSSNPDLTLDIKKHAARVRSVIQSLVRESKGSMSFEEIDPTGDTERTFAAIRSGVQEISLQQGGGFFFGLVVKIRDREHAIARLEPNEFNYFEYYLGQLMAELTKTKQKRIGIVTSLDPTQSDSLPRFLKILAKDYDLVWVNEDKPELAPNLDAVIVYVAPYIRVETTFALDQYLVNGGRALVIMDPYFRQGLGSKFETPNRNSDQRKTDHPADLLRHWGVDYDYVEVVEDRRLAQIATMEGLGDSRYPMWLNLSGGQINYKMPFLKQVKRLSLAESGHYKITDKSAEGIIATPLLKTTDASRYVPRYLFDTIAPQILSQKAKGDEKERYLAAMVQGKLSSAFDKLPDLVADYYLDFAPIDQSVNLEEMAKFKKESQKEAVVITVADADFLTDRFSMFSMGQGQQPIPANSNISMVLDMVRYLVGDHRLLGLFGKLDKQRNFTLLEEMLSLQSATYQEEEQELMRDYFVVTTQMRAINKQSANEDFVNHQLEEKRIALAKEELELRFKLRQIREEMRSSIESFGQVIALLNLLVAPILLLIFGGFYLLRRKSLVK